MCAYSREGWFCVAHGIERLGACNVNAVNAVAAAEVATDGILTC